MSPVKIKCIGKPFCGQSLEFIIYLSFEKVLTIVFLTPIVRMLKGTIIARIAYHLINLNDLSRLYQ